MEALFSPANSLFVLGIILITVEILLGAVSGFELLVIGLILIVAGGVTSVFGLTVGLATIVVLSVLYFFIGRKMLKKSLDITTQHTNTESIIGKTGQTIKAISPKNPGQVKVKGEIWRAVSNESIRVGEHAKIVSVSGVSLKVKKE